MPRRHLPLLFVVASSCVTTVGSFPITHLHQPRVRIALSAGFGASSTSRKTVKKTKNKKKKGLVSALGGEIHSKKDSRTPQLDRFGLPPPTEESVFPALDDSVLRTPLPRRQAAFNRTLVERATRDHLGVDLENFDDEGLSVHRGEGTWKLNLLHCDPPVFSIDNFFTSEECHEYMEMTSGDGSDDAVQVISPTFSAASISRRTSTTWFCRYKGVPTLLAKAQRLLNVTMSQMEEPQLVRYRTGEEFSWHYDEIPKQQLANGGQRLATLLVYLNEMDEGMGGGTIFRDLQESRAKGRRKAKMLSVRPQAGKALLFFPAFKDGRPDVRTLHKGEVASETKKIAQLWVHEGVYKASVPDQNRQEDADELVMQANERLGFARTRTQTR